MITELVLPELSTGETFVLTTALATTSLIPYQARGGQVHIPLGSSITSLTWGSYDPVNKTRHPAYIEDGSTAVTQTGLAAGNSYPIPSTLFGCHTIIVYANAAGPVVITKKG